MSGMEIFGRLVCGLLLFALALGLLLTGVALIRLDRASWDGWDVAAGVALIFIARRVVDGSWDIAAAIRLPPRGKTR